jgi:hypothetical protein
MDLIVAPDVGTTLASIRVARNGGAARNLGALGAVEDESHEQKSVR